MNFLASFLNPIQLKKMWVVVLSLGWLLSLTMLVVYDRQKAKTEQYAELNTFLAQRLKVISGERTKLEMSLQAAIERGLETQNKIELQHEKDNKIIQHYFDTVTVSEIKRIFEYNYGKIGQRKIKVR